MVIIIEDGPFMSPDPYPGSVIAAVFGRRTGAVSD